MSNLQNKSLVVDLQGGGGDVEAGLCLVSSFDTFAQVLNSKLLNGGGLIRTIVNGSGDASLVLDGSEIFRLVSVETSSNTGITSQDIVRVIAQATFHFVFLPALPAAGKYLTIVNDPTSTTNVQIFCAGSDKLDGSNSKALSPGNSVTIFPFVAEWNTIKSN